MHYFATQVRHIALHDTTMKAITVRIEPEQERKLEELKTELHNSDAGVLRFAIDQLYKVVKATGPIPQQPETANAA